PRGLCGGHRQRNDIGAGRPQRPTYWTCPLSSTSWTANGYRYPLPLITAVHVKVTPARWSTFTAVHVKVTPARWSTSARQVTVERRRLWRRMDSQIACCTFATFKVLSGPGFS